MKSYIFAALVCFAMAIALMAPHGPDVADAFSIFGKFETVKGENGVVTIPLDDVNDGEAHYYTYEHQGSEINFFLVKSSDGVIRAAFDACDVCYQARQGYSQKGEFMVCNNCGMQFHSTRINVVKGGCNPAPLRRVQKDGQVIIAVQDIIPGKRFF